MNSAFPILFGLIFSILGCVFGWIISNRHSKHFRESLSTQIQQAEKEITEDINKIGRENLHDTEHGRELLRLILTEQEAKIKSLKELFETGSRMDAIPFNLKYLDTLEKIGDGTSTKYVIPIEFFDMLKELIQYQTNKDNINLSNANNQADYESPTKHS